MPNNRAKGKRFERWFAIKLRDIFPQVMRNAGEQAQQGGVDLINTGEYAFEIKAGKAYQSKMVRALINQIEMEAKPNTIRVVLVKPDREKPYAILPFDDFVQIIKD
jgi:Holliday junction resolvase